MQAEIIAIGSELTSGASLDTNSQWLSRELALAGISVARHTAVADAPAVLVEEFRFAASRSQVVIITGGLGPTLDDLTRQCLADAFNQPLIEDEEARRHLEELFRLRGREMPQRNRIQAMRPRDAEMIANSRGTAPGILLRVPCGSETGECLLAALPGVPREMMLMFQESVVPILPTASQVIRQSVLRTFGLGESDVEAQLGDLTSRGRNPEVGITASDAVISLAITAIAATESECEELIEKDRAAICRTLGNIVYAEGDQELQQITVAMLSKLGQSVSVAEGTTTGGLIHQWLTTCFALEAAHISDGGGSATQPDLGLPRWLVDGIVAPHRMDAATDASSLNSATASDDHPDSEALISLAEHHCVASGADFSIATSNMVDTLTATGIWRRLGSVAIVGSNFRCVRDVSFSGNLAIFQARAAKTALNLLRLHLLEQMDRV